jgi:predicted ATPase/DNA-binding SARP family transcriptional activator
VGAALDLWTLGGLRILLEHEPVEGLRSRTAEALLVFLVRQGRPLSREWLAEFFWPERPHETSLVNLRVALHRLNKTLAPHLVVTRKSVGLRDDNLPYLDGADFERLLNERKPREALGLYRGDFLRGFYLPGSPAFESWAADERDRLRDLALAAYQELLVRHAATAETDEAVRLARGLLHLEPFHEPTQRLLVRLLAQSGRRQAAIEAFEGYRTRLRDDLGLEPDEESLALLERVKHGLGDGADAFDDAVASRAAVPWNLPPLSTPLLGRQAELDALQTRLSHADCRLVTLVAPGGMGKTRLAIEAALRAAPTFPDGVCFVSLAGVISPAAIAPAVAQSLALVLPPSSDERTGLLAYLRTKRMLLVLDNFEELLEGAPLLLELVHHAPGVKLLVTSRERLALSEEWVLPLAGLEADGAAVELFVQRAMRAAHDFDPTAEREAVRELCSLVEGMPLAIELAASWAGMMTCRMIAHEVRASLDVLEAHVRDLPERHRSIRSLFDTSWRLLSAEARSVFMRLSVFRGGFTAAEAWAVAGATLGGLRTLVEKSLLRADGRGRFALHELIRQYAAERLAAAGGGEVTAARHFDAFLALAEEAEPQLFGSEQPTWLQRLELEWDNFRAALTWGFDGGKDSAELVRLVLALSWFWRRSAIHDARHWLERALSLEGLRAQHRAALLSHAGHVAWMQARWDVAEAELLESLALWDELGLQGEHDAARTRCSLAMTRAIQGRVGDARALLEEALVVFEEHDNDWWIAFALALLGKSALAQREYGRAKESLFAGLAIYRRIGNRWGLGLFLGTAAQLQIEAGTLQEARALAEEAVTLLIEVGHKHALGEAYRMLGEISWAEGRQAEAEENYRCSITTYQEIGQEAFADRVAAELARSRRSGRPHGGPVRAGAES